MFKFVVLATCVFASAQAGLIAGGASYAAGPALGAPLLGRVTVNPAETTIVKQQVIVDQPEIRVRSIPTVVQTAPIVQTVQAAPVLRTVQAAPVVQTVQAAPVLRTVQAAPVVQQVVAQPQVQQLTYSALPAVNTIGYNTVGINTLGYNTVGINTLGYNTLGVNGLTYSGLGLNGINTINGLGLVNGGLLLKK